MFKLIRFIKNALLMDNFLFTEFLHVVNPFSTLVDVRAAKWVGGSRLSISNTGENDGIYRELYV